LQGFLEEVKDFGVGLVIGDEAVDEFTKMIGGEDAEKGLILSPVHPKGVKAHPWGVLTQLVETVYSFHLGEDG
jgi:hypothetical protein